MAMRGYWLGLVTLVGCNAIFGLDEVTPAAGDGGATSAGGSGTGGETASVGGAGGISGQGGAGATSTGGAGGEDPCGNGVVDEGETCDGDCIEPIDCFDPDLCTLSVVTGAEVCNAECTHTLQQMCADDDGCCPSGCEGGDADCQPPVMVMGADPNDALLSTLANALSQTGLFDQVATFDTASGTPTSGTVSPYYAVVYVGVDTPQNSAGTGNVLADYVDAGGRVVMILWEECDTRAPGGRFLSQSYYVLPPGGYTYAPSSLGTVQEPNHPLMTNVDAMDTEFICQPLSFGSEVRVIASWPNAEPAVAARALGGAIRVDINVQPNTTTLQADLDTLIANAIFYTQPLP